VTSLKKGLIGSVLLVSQSFIAKSVGLISTLVLARVLVPEDFGLVAMATIFMGMVQIFGKTGGGEYIIRARNVDDNMLDTNWTINLLLKCCIVTATLISAPFVADYFGDERVAHILYVSCLITVITSLGNPGINLLRREQNYKPIIVMNLIGKCIAVIIAVTIALVYESFWALVLGQAVANVLKTAGSYFISPYRPWFCLKNIKDQLSFSSWIMGQSLLGYARTQMDSFLVASNFSQSQLGQYNVMKYLAFLPNILVLSPATGPLLRQLSAINDTGKYFNKRLNVATIIGLGLALYISAILYMNSSLFVELLLGKQWLEYSHLFSLFAYLIPAYLMFHMANRIFVVFNNTKTIFFYELFSSSIILTVLISIGITSVDFFSLVRVSLENALSLIFLAFAYIKYTGIQNLVRLITLLIPMILSVFFAYIAANYLTWQVGYILIDLAISSLLFTAFFILFNMLFLFFLKGRVDEYGILEQYKNQAIQQFNKFIANKKSKI
jgi:lipopolysaccharide exporter